LFEESIVRQLTIAILGLSCAVQKDLIAICCRLSKLGFPLRQGYRGQESQDFLSSKVFAQIHRISAKTFEERYRPLLRMVWGGTATAAK